MLAIDTTDHNPRSRAKNVGNPDISAKEETEALDIYKTLSREAQIKFLAWCRWACDDGSSETDPRKTDPYWLQFEALQAAL